MPTQEMVITAVSPPTATPSPTITPVPLGGCIQDQVEPGVIRPDKPLVMVFDQALLERSAAEPLLFDPPVAGSFSWFDEGMRLVFTPDQDFAAGEHYQITQSSQLHTQSGSPLGEPLVWQINTLSALFMASSETQESEAISEDEWLITFPIDFPREVDWQSVEEEILVEPAVPVKIGWWENGRFHQKDIPDDAGRTVNQSFASFPEKNQMLVQARVPFDFEQTYRFVLQEWVTGCSCSTVLKDAFEREFAIPPLETEIVKTDVVPQFRFNYRLDLDSLLSAVMLDPEFETEWHAEWDGDETVLTMDPSRLLPNKILYDLRFHEPVYHEKGVLIAQPGVMMARFPTPFIITDEYPGREHWIKFNPTTNVELTFAHEMDEQSVVDAFQIEPDVAGTFSWMDNQLIFQPEGGHLDAFSQYTITLGTSAQDSDGRSVLPEPYMWQFETSELPTDADFGLGPKIQMVDSNGRRAVQYRSYPQEPIDVTFGLYALASEAARQFLLGAHDSETGPEISRWTAVTEPQEPDDFRYASVQETNIPPNVPPGPYLMTLDAGSSHDELLVFISENTVAAKMAGSQITVWTAKINGEVAGSLDVTVLDENGGVVANGRSSDEGLFQTNLPDNTQAAFVIVQDGNDLAAAGLNGDWQTIMGNYNYSSCRECRWPLKTIVSIHTDRPLYRPNETVFFKAILRDDNDAQMETVPIGSLVTARLITPDEAVLQALDLETNAFGSVYGQFQLPDTAVSGDYQIEIITADGYTASQIFKVDAYQQSGNYEVTVSTDAESYVADDTVSVTVDSAYLTGDPVVNAEVEVNLFFPGWERWDLWWEPSESITGTTDVNGRFTAQFESIRGNFWTIEAVVDDGNGQKITGFKRMQVDAVEGVLQLSIGAYHKEPGIPITSTVTVQDNFGEPIVGREVNLELNHYVPSNHKWETVHLDSGQTDENGRYAFTFTPPELGFYYLDALIIDSSGHRLATSKWFIVYSEANHTSPWFAYSDDAELRFAYTGDVYMPGEPAKLFIQSTVAGPALLTIESSNVQRQQIVDLTPPLTMVEISLTENDSPNLFATIMVWKPYEPPEWLRGAFNLPEYQLFTAMAYLTVATTPHVLNVEILPAQASYQPGEEVQMTLRVTDHAGEPVSAELSLSVVDEAIFQLSPDFSEPMHDAFYFQRENQVTNYDAMHAQRQLWYDVRDVIGEHSGLSYYGLFENYQNIDYAGNRAPGGPHGEFVGTAVWYPALYTDANGEVTVSFTLPDEPATWRIHVRAITRDSQVGEGVYSFAAD